MPSKNTAIGWTDDSWNPSHGCFKVSEGCANCYAARDSHEHWGHTPEPWTVDNLEANLKLQSHHMDWPRSQAEPRRIFVNSMSDLFLPEEVLPDEYLHRIMDVIEEEERHVFQGLTKHGCETTAKHGDVPRLLRWDREYGRWPDNLWMGVSVENENRAYRYEQLKETGAATKWISFEPLVGEVTTLDLEGIDWAAVGGESGPDFRPMDHAWARAIRDACRETGTAFFFKQSAASRNETDRVLAEAYESPQMARLQGEEAKPYRELPDALTPELADARPDLAEQVVA